MPLKPKNHDRIGHIPNTRKYNYEKARLSAAFRKLEFSVVHTCSFAGESYVKEHYELCRKFGLLSLDSLEKRKLLWKKSFSME